ncbi:thioredoxin fold domain-containing protein [Colwellia sp. MEBiC06753]
MQKLFSVALCLAAVVCSSFTFAETSTQVPASIAKPASAGFNAKQLKSLIENTLGLKVFSAKQSNMPGLAELVTEEGLFYSSYDGKYFIQGKLYQLGENVANLTEESLADVRLQGMKKFEDDMIVYPAKDEKYVVTVFTDITCGYCRKMHSHMEEYNDLGITVRYLAYPRAGVYQAPGTFSKGFEDLRSIWCSENPNDAMDRGKSGSSIPRRICDKPVAENFDFGRQVGVTGTPAVILANGFMFSGYRDPEQLLKILQTL